jgi:TetR/AcrR family transcriptional regulator, transcriptional repressor for nem operon
MRYWPGHKLRTRARILDAARRLFKTRGYPGTGVDAIMASEGLTAGGFYAHFDSKEALLAETFTQAFEATREVLLRPLEGRSGVDWLRVVVRRYLSRAHRDNAADGCPLPTLGADVARTSETVRAQFQRYFEALADECERKLDGSPGLVRDQVLANLAMCVGGLVLARAVSDASLSDRILRSCRRYAPTSTVVP